MFEFFYMSSYKILATGDSDMEIAQNILLQHIRVLVVANKYMAGELESYAFDKIQDSILNHGHMGSSIEFFTFIIRTVYIEKNLFSHDEDTPKKDQECGDKDESQGEKKTSTDAFEHDDEMDSEDTDSDAKSEGANVELPIDRVKKVLFEAATVVWARFGEHEDFPLSALSDLARKYPEFGYDLTIYALDHNLTLTGT